MDQFYEQAKVVEKLLLDWARPEGWAESPLKDYPLAHFDTAITIAIAYLAFVIFGSVRNIQH